MEKKILIVNVKVAVAGSGTGRSKYDVLEVTELDEHIKNGWVLESKEVVVPPQSASYYSIVLTLKK